MPLYALFLASPTTFGVFPRGGDSVDDVSVGQVLDRKLSGFGSEEEMLGHGGSCQLFYVK